MLHKIEAGGMVVWVNDKMLKQINDAIREEVLKQAEGLPRPTTIAPENYVYKKLDASVYETVLEYMETKSKEK